MTYTSIPAWTPAHPEDEARRLHLADGAAAFASLRASGVIERLVRRFLGRRRRVRRFADDVREVAAAPAAHVEVRDVPITAVVGSVGRASDYTPSFRPVRPEDAQRWSSVRAAMLHACGVPPVDLLELAGRYYVVDGHHRVSIWRAMGVRTIEARVRRVVTLSEGRRLRGAEGVHGR
jgi:uncharacterized ParB-like nuclease family protein